MNYAKVSYSSIPHFTTYKGANITKSGTGFIAVGKQVDTYSDAMTAIENAYSSLSKSMRIC